VAGIKAKPRKPNTKIKPSDLSLESSIVRFSFKHLCVAHPKFSVTEKKSNYFCKVLERLKDLSTWKITEILSNRSAAIRAHPINWDDTTEKNGFSELNDQLQSIQAYQVQISSNEHGRIHGFFIDNVFFIIWLDPEHKLYS